MSAQVPYFSKSNCLYGLSSLGKNGQMQIYAIEQGPNKCLKLIYALHG